MIELRAEPYLVAIVLLFETTLCLYMKSPIASFEVGRLGGWRATVWSIAIKIFDSDQDTSNPILRVDLCRLVIDVDPCGLARLAQSRSSLILTCRSSLFEPIETRRRIVGTMEMRCAD